MCISNSLIKQYESLVTLYNLNNLARLPNLYNGRIYKQCAYPTVHAHLN